MSIFSLGHKHDRDGKTHLSLQRRLLGVTGGENNRHSGCGVRPMRGVY